MQGKREEICLQNNQPSTSYSIKKKSKSNILKIKIIVSSCNLFTNDE